MKSVGMVGSLWIVSTTIACAFWQTSIEAQQFWDYYFRDRLLTLRHAKNAWAGEALTDAGSGTVAMFRQRPKTRSFRLSDAELRSYDYDADPRFARLSRQPLRIDAAFAAVRDKIYPYADSPFDKARMAELFTLADARYGLNPSRPITQDEVERSLLDMISRNRQEQSQVVAALVWFLGERRERSSGRVALEILRHSSYVQDERSPVSSTAADAAFLALRKIDDKTTLTDLIGIMQSMNETGRRRCSELLRYLLSSGELLHPDRAGAAISTAEFWTERIASMRNRTAVDWDRYDATSVQWEIRYAAASRLDASDPALRGLSLDPVTTVRRMADERSKNK